MGIEAATIGMIALFEAIEGDRQKEYGFLANDFRLTGNSINALANCILYLKPEDTIMVHM